MFDELIRTVAFYLFQAGAFAHPGFVETNYMLISRIETTRFGCCLEKGTEPIRTELCKVLVMERLKKFETGIFGFEEFTENNKDGELLSRVEDPMVEFLKWYKDMTSLPFSLHFQCRTLIRRILTSLSDRRSILPRIDSLDLPNKLK